MVIAIYSLSCIVDILNTHSIERKICCEFKSRKGEIVLRIFRLFILIGLFLASFATASVVCADVLFREVLVFNGKKEMLIGPTNVLVQGNIITQISENATASGDTVTTVVEGHGNVLMPGLIDNHWHSMLSLASTEALMMADIGYVNILAGKGANEALMRGFTSLRDLGGPAFSLKRAIDQGLIAGPRIYPAGAMISQTGGHGDFRLPYEIPKEPNSPLGYAEQVGVSAIADSPDDVRLRTREQLMKGAVLIKLMAGGGVASVYDPLDAVQYTEAEVRAAVEAAENWGTYVTVHAYTPRAIQMAMKAGVKCVEHGQLADEETVKIMSEKNIWWSLQPFLDDEDANPRTDPQSRSKQLEVSAGTDNAYALAKKYGIKVAWGTDILGSAQGTLRHGSRLVKMQRWYTSAEVLRMATSVNAELLALSGARNPYPGKLGVVEEGALADLLLVRGNPLEDLSLLEKPEGNMLVIMKDGILYKNID